ncbi:MAG: YggS family pyridoxal phosphate-dependent enzyme [Candidatus Dormibacteraeota bacterium]|nr:YggS family pyridoxal phosphate-dependent enzyme [Candidatus Dormibacteraeota bacterium]
MHDAHGDIAANIAAVRARIDAAARRAGRDAQDVRLIAVSKGFDAARINQAIEAGITDIGENRVQEAAAKRDGVTHEVNWHLVGHLQTNKAKAAAAMFDAVHSLDSERVARALAEHRPGDSAPLAALIEVELTGIAARTGVAEADAEAVLRAAAGLPGVHVLGLMTIAPPGGADQARACFQRLGTLRERLERSSGWALPELSMGMSGDYEVAVEEGATMVRIGRAIFGDRPALRA